MRLRMGQFIQVGEKFRGKGDKGIVQIMSQYQINHSWKILCTGVEFSRKFIV